MRTGIEDGQLERNQLAKTQIVDYRGHYAPSIIYGLRIQSDSLETTDSLQFQDGPKSKITKQKFKAAQQLATFKMAHCKN